MKKSIRLKAKYLSAKRIIILASLLIWPGVSYADCFSVNNCNLNQNHVFEINQELEISFNTENSK
jgi:hypothetical protein